MKGISTVIASILMLMIVVALAGTTYLYVSNTLTGKTAAAFEVTSSLNDSVTIRNLGTQPIGKITSTLDGSPINTIFDLNDNLVAYWKMDDGAGTTIKDSSGKGNAGTLNNGPGWVDGKFGKAMQFDGVNDYISLTSSPSSLVSNTMTISLWVNPSVDWNTVPGPHRYFIYTIGGSKGFWLKANSGTGDLDFATGDGTIISATMPFDWTANTWYHLVIVYDGTKAVFYVNDVPIGTSTNVKTSIGPSPTAGTISDSQNAMAGILDEFRIYNKALSPKEIDVLYKADGESVLDAGQTITITPLTEPAKGTHTLKLCTPSMCNTAFVTVR